jgi:hypothetical protein
MPKENSQLPAQWRRRREEYLRASGRHADLIKEGYVPVESPTDWIVVVGHRKGSSKGNGAKSELFVVKGRRVESEPRATLGRDEQVMSCPQPLLSLAPR